MRRTIATLGTGTAIALCSLTACTAPVADSSHRPAPAPRLTNAQLDRIQRAEGRLIQRCMTERGFRYWPVPPANAEAGHSSGFVLDDVAWARAHGYGSDSPRQSLAQQRQNPNRAYVESLSGVRRAAYSAALTGDASEGVLTAELPTGGTLTTPRGGCRATAEKKLYGDRETWFRVNGIAMNLTPLWVPKLVKDARFTKALAAWSACMRDKGHTYADPPGIRAALPALTKGLSREGARAVETELAVAEATCARDSRLADRARSLKRTYFGPVRAKYREELAVHSRLQQAALTRAEALTRRN
ncbi:hypothetical protein [Streptomyces sp. NPDC029674]|uniref:hypothetical protein n=1 Tax=Streptomyces sp. NPDC029674 TaxID=3365297 RepID=UPI00384DBED5